MFMFPAKIVLFKNNKKHILAVNNKSKALNKCDPDAENFQLHVYPPETELLTSFGNSLCLTNPLVQDATKKTIPCVNVCALLGSLEST